MSLRKAIGQVALNEATKPKYTGTFEKGRGPTGIAYAIPNGHPDAENPKTRKKYPERQTPQYKKEYKAILKQKAPKLLRDNPISEELEEDTLNESFKRFAGNKNIEVFLGVDNKNNDKPIYYRIFHKTKGDYHSSGQSINIPIDMVKEFKQLITKLK
tara:strand:+ start:80 stop:550 length:471 start_codon:yes stop_codon:yes gene_type:complete